MPKRAQMDYQRPQTAFRTRRTQSIYTRTERDESFANGSLLRSLKSTGNDYEFSRPKSLLKIVKRLANPKYINPKLGKWVHNTYDDVVMIIEPSKYFDGMYTRQWSHWKNNNFIDESTVNTIKQTAKGLYNMLLEDNYSLVECYEDYKDIKSLITKLPTEELKAKKEAERLKREKFAEPFYNWLSN